MSTITFTSPLRRDLDLDALFAPPEPEEVAAVWATVPEKFAADRFRLLGEPLVRDGVVGQFLEYYSEGLRIYGQLYRPGDPMRGPFPLLVHNHGAVKGIPSLEPRPGEPVPHFVAECWALARHGYVVLVSGYRGEWTPLGVSDGEIEVGKGEVTDVLNLLACGKTLTYVDASRIGALGSSHGGWTTAFAAQRSTDLRAGICHAAPGLLSFHGQGSRGSMREWVEQLATGRAIDPPLHPGPAGVVRQVFVPLLEGRATVEETRHEMIARVPALFAEHTTCPLFLTVGDADDLYEHTIDLDVALARAGKEHEFRVFRGEGHGFSPTARQTYRALVLDFFARRLG